MHLRLYKKIVSYFPLIVSQRLREWLVPYESVAILSGDVESESLHGTKLIAPMGDRHQYKMFFHGCFDWRNACVARVLCHSGDTIIEVGANVGTETLDFAGVVGATGRVIAYEPHPRNAGLLERAIQSNDLRQVTLHRRALGAKTGKVQFKVPDMENDSGVGHLVSRADGGHEESARMCIEVDCSQLDQEQLPRASAIFVDVEGWECSVLEGAIGYLNTHKPALVLEACDKLQRRAGRSVEELAGIVTALGYEIWSIERWGIRPWSSGNSVNFNGNWLCLGPDHRAIAKSVSRTIGLSYVLPPIRGLHPLRMRTKR